MKNPLHDQKEQFLILSKGQLIGWGIADAKNLLKKANTVKSENLESNSDVGLWEYECILSHLWLEMIHEKGNSEIVVKKLNSRIQKVRYHHVLTHSPVGPHWRRIANGDQIDDPEVGVAYGVAHLLTIGALKGLNRCQMIDCRKFFIGPPNKIWCSEKCGSKHRVGKKRKKERNKKHVEL